MFKVLDLFSGIGGFSLGLERTGHFKTVAFCEIDNYCQRVLHKHWPGVYIHSDIRTLTAKHFDGWERPDVLCGGFPCQNISCAGRRDGIDGDKSWLWAEYFRLISELRPRYVIVENVADIVHRGIERVLGDLASIGFDAEWACVTAAGFSAPHIRERFFLVGYPNSFGLPERSSESLGRPPIFTGSHSLGAWPESTHRPDVAGVATRIPRRVDRVKHLGNSIVPQIATWIGQRIVEARGQ